LYAKLVQQVRPAKQGIHPLDFFVVFARPDDTSRTGEKLCISFAVIFYRKARQVITQRGAKPG
jgi:hypothetical protein